MRSRDSQEYGGLVVRPQVVDETRSGVLGAVGNPRERRNESLRVFDLEPHGMGRRCATRDSIDKW